jgi:hypothetical protein
MRRVSISLVPLASAVAAAVVVDHWRALGGGVPARIATVTLQVLLLLTTTMMMLTRMTMMMALPTFVRCFSVGCCFSSF